MGAFTTWPSWPASGSAAGGAAGAAGAGRASAAAGAVPRPTVATDAGAILTAPPLTIFTFSSPSVISSSAMPDSWTRSISFFSLRRSIASSPPGGYSALGTCGGLQRIFWIFAGEGCILAQQPFENLLHLRSGKRAEPAMSDRTHPVEPDSIGQSALLPHDRCRYTQFLHLSRIRASRLASAIAQERPDLRDSGAVHHSAGLRGLQRKPLVARIEYRQLERRAAPR